MAGGSFIHSLCWEEWNLSFACSLTLFPWFPTLDVAWSLSTGHGSLEFSHLMQCVVETLCVCVWAEGDEREPVVFFLHKQGVLVDLTLFPYNRHKLYDATFEYHFQLGLFRTF